jgi:hypothetical protein
LAVYLSHPAVQAGVHVTESKVKQWGKHGPGWDGYTRSFADVLAEMPAIIEQFRVRLICRHPPPLSC